MKKYLIAAGLACSMAMGSVAHAGTHVHFASFWNSGGKAGFVFPATVEGDDIEGPMVKLGAEMMLFTHSVSIHDGDVLNLQNDTLRETTEGFKDFGLNCQISIHSKGAWTVSGMCESFITGGKNNNLIPPVSIPKELVWYKVFEDKKQGIAGYFMKETGKDYSK